MKTFSLILLALVAVMNIVSTPLFAGEPRLLLDGEYQRELFQQVKQAKDSIYISTFVFKLGKHPKNKVNQLVQLLAKAVKRGVKVVVLLEKSDHNKSLNQDNQTTAKRLKQLGVQVRFDHPKRQSHGKVAIFDESWILLGSHNLTHSALAKNHEVSLLWQQPEEAKRLLRYLNSL